MVLLEFSAQGKAIHAWHHYIEEDNVRRLDADLFKGLLRVVSGDNRVAGIMEDGGEKTQVNWMIVDHKNYW